MQLLMRCVIIEIAEVDEAKYRWKTEIRARLGQFSPFQEFPKVGL